MEIELKNISCGYKRKKILKNINLSFKTGNIYTILGGNGIGKTTLFKSILGFIDLKGGDICFDGKSITSMTEKEIATFVSYVPQAKNYSMQYTVFDIILMGRALHIKKFGIPSDRDIARVNAVMEQMKIDKFKNLMYSELSGGEQQIVLIARALVQESKFIIMDEPASNLDFENIKMVLDVLKELRHKDIGIIMSSHSPDHALYCNDHVVMISKDKKIIEGSVQQTITQKNLYSVYGVQLDIISSEDVYGNVRRSCCLL